VVLAARHAYGQGFIRFGHTEIDAAPLLANTPIALAADKAGMEDGFLQQVATVEGEYGPYAAGLSESLYDLGRFYQSAGDADSALAVFRRGLHVIRINDGLNSAAQVPLLRATLDTYRMSGDFEGLDDRYDYYYVLLGVGQPPHTDVRLRVALAYLRWQREALRLDIDRSRDRRLYNLLRLTNGFLDIIAQDESMRNRWFAHFVLSQVKNLYLLQASIEPRVELRETARSSLSMPSSRIDDDPISSSLQRQLYGAASKGSALLHEALLRLPQACTGAGARPGRPARMERGGSARGKILRCRY
jgi:hypothetical protein